MALLVSPAEPAALRSIGVTSSLAEHYGADFLVPTVRGFVGVQRKTVRDFIASLRDGRLHEDVLKMRGLATRILLVEGHPVFSSEGALESVSNDALRQGPMVYSRFSASSWWGLLLSIAEQGTWLAEVGNMAETKMWLSEVERWSTKDGHVSLERRPGPPNADLGLGMKRQWQVHLLQGIQGIGPDTARSIVEHFDGLPLAWTVGEKELCEVAGVGKARAKQMMGALS